MSATIEIISYCGICQHCNWPVIILPPPATGGKNDEVKRFRYDCPNCGHPVGIIEEVVKS